MMDENIIQLIHRQVDGSITAGEKIRLEAYLKQNPEARQAYLGRPRQGAQQAQEGEDLGEPQQDQQAHEGGGRRGSTRQSPRIGLPEPPGHHSRIRVLRGREREDRRLGIQGDLP